MAETETTDDSGATISAPAPLFPPPNVPALAIDFVPSISYGPGIVKFYLCRMDADVHGRGGVNVAPVAQIVMPTTSFAHMVVFFERQVELLIERGQLSMEEVGKFRAALASEAASDVTE